MYQHSYPLSEKSIPRNEERGDGFFWTGSLPTGNEKVYRYIWDIWNDDYGILSFAEACGTFYGW